MGVKLRGRLPQGTRVSVIKSTPAIIIACHGTVPPDNDSADLFRTTSGFGPNVEEQFGDESCDGSNMGARLPADLFEGEFVMDNLLGVGIHLLTTLAKLQASDLAKVEAMLTDDTVRIIDRTFKHISSEGIEQIYNDGRVNARLDASSYPHEVAGVEEDKSPKGTSNSGVVDEEPVAPTGRWRYSHYRGYLGDFLHFFITDPVAGIAQLAQERAGKLHVHAGNDGTLIVRSVSDIVFERVSRISVPVEQKEYFHPDGNTVADYAKPATTHLESWNFDPTKPWKAAYYLRDYARWLSQHHAYARFLQADKDWKVAADSKTPEPSYGNQEKDREQRMPAAAKKVKETYATFRLLRDGSYVVLDGYGSSWMMAGGDISCSAARHLRMEAGSESDLINGGLFEIAEWKPPTKSQVGKSRYFFWTLQA